MRTIKEINGYLVTINHKNCKLELGFFQNLNDAYKVVGEILAGGR